MTEPSVARIHLLPARREPVVVILRRKPSKRFHVLTWNTRTDEIVSGSWFQGHLYSLRCDVSFNGRWLVYLALGSTGQTWNGICCLPWLKTVAEGTNFGTWRGGGYWSRPRLLRINAWEISATPTLRKKLPFNVETYRSPYGEDEGVLYERLERDGWKRAGPIGTMRRIKEARKYTVVCENDPGWYWQPSPKHPTLRMFYLGYLSHGRTFSFALDEHPNLLDSAVDWATWDALGSLVVARGGGVERYSPDDLASGRPGFCLSLEDLAPPARDADGESP
jgi:hypothetical protein